MVNNKNLFDYRCWINNAGEYIARHYGEGHDINYAKALAKIRKFKDADIGERFNMQLDESFAAYAKNGYTAD